jgi:hypothetical protein
MLPGGVRRSHWSREQRRPQLSGWRRRSPFKALRSGGCPGAAKEIRSRTPSRLSSSVCIKKMERVMTTGFVMVPCLLVYRLAEHCNRQRLTETEAIVPDQLKKPTRHPTLRWLFQCFEGISLARMQQVMSLTEVHLLILVFDPPCASTSLRQFDDADTGKRCR